MIEVEKVARSRSNFLKQLQYKSPQFTEPQDRLFFLFLIKAVAV
jgi:hypothetical protein